MTPENQEQLKQLCEKARYSKEVSELTTFVMRHKNEYIGNPDVQRSVDSFAFLTAWIYDVLEQRRFDNERSITKKVRKALGYLNL